MHQPRTMRRLAAVVPAALVALWACGDRGSTASPVSGNIAETDAGAPVTPAPPSPVADAGTDSGVLAIPYWRIERPGDSKRAWLVTPEGVRQFGLGLDGVLDPASCNGIQSYIAATTPAEEWSRVASYGFNNAGVSTAITAAPHSVTLPIAPTSDDYALRDANGNVLVTGLNGVKVADPFNPKFASGLDAMCEREVVTRRTDENLQIYYPDDEAGMFDVASPTGGVRDFRHWLWSQCPATSTPSTPQCAPHALVQFLGTKYPTLAAFNTAWGSTYASFDEVASSAAKPIPYTATCNDTCRADLATFVVDKLLTKWIFFVTNELRTADSSRLVATPRLAIGNSAQFHFWTSADTYADNGQPVDMDLLPLLGKFDVIAIDVYSANAQFEEPWLSDGIDHLVNDIGLPVIVSATGLRTKVTGWSNQTTAPAFVADQATRGANYATQLKQLAGFTQVVGVNWHTWSDHYVENDPTTQLEQGLFQCDSPDHGFTAGAPWTDALAGVKSANASVLSSIGQ